MITVTMRKSATGETKVIPMPDLDWKGDFVWAEGNFACDCNRAIFWGDRDESCGDERFAVLEIKDERGNVVYRDD